jgi:nucleoside-diphosphate-sugar epimerase
LEDTASGAISVRGDRWPQGAASESVIVGRVVDLDNSPVSDVTRSEVSRGAATAGARSLRIVLTGTTGPLQRRVVEGLEALGDVTVFETMGNLDGFESDTADVVLDMASSDHDWLAAHRSSATQFATTSLGLADALTADQVVFVSSAMVYGANENNPFPLTEETILRPDNEFVFARQLASAEELVEQWRRSRTGRASCVLRPAIGLAADGNSRLAAAVVSGLGKRFAEDDPPSQFVHLDDLASAIVLAVRDRLDGVYNVAPDGWIPGERVRALSGERPRLPLPERLSEVLGMLSWRFQRGPIPPGLRSYTHEPWVVSNGRLVGAGWTPSVTNEQTYVEGTEARWWTMISPKRRQELSLGVGAVLLTLLTIAGVVIGRRWWRRRQQP